MITAGACCWPVAVFALRLIRVSPCMRCEDVHTVTSIEQSCTYTPNPQTCLLIGAADIEDVDAVISTIGGTTKDPSADSTGNINVIEAAAAKGVKKFILVTSIGCGDTKDAPGEQVRVVGDSWGRLGACGM